MFHSFAFAVSMILFLIDAVGKNFTNGTDVCPYWKLEMSFNLNKKGREILDFVELTSNYAMNPIFVLDTTNWLIAGMIAFISICAVARMVQQKQICITQAVVAVLLFTYLFLIFCSTVIARPNLGMHSYQLHPFWSYKVIEKGRTDLLAENLLNVGMLVPVGILLPLLSRRIKCRHVIFAAFLISYTIEFSQLIFCKGLFELVDDPFHNVLGAVVGYGIYRVVRRIVTIGY